MEWSQKDFKVGENDCVRFVTGFLDIAMCSVDINLQAYECTTEDVRTVLRHKKTSIKKGFYGMSLPLVERGNIGDIALIRDSGYYTVGISLGRHVALFTEDQGVVHVPAGTLDIEAYKRVSWEK